MSLEIKRNKVCINCKIEKSINEFWKKIKYKDWINSICKICNRIAFKEYYLNNKEKVSKKTKIYYQEHIYEYKEYFKIYSPKYRNSENWKNKKRIIDHDRRIKLLKKYNDWTINEKSTLQLLTNQDYKCWYCWLDIVNNISRHLDHINPLSKGWIHTISNVHWTCKKCNLSKNSKTHEEYLKIIEW